MSQAQTLSAVSGAPIDPILYVLYGTETGNAQNLALSASAVAESAGLNARVLGLDQIAATELTKLRHALFIVSTTGDGEMPYTAFDFWNLLSSDDFPPIDNLHYGVLALGDTAYADFCAAGVALDERLAQCGAARLLDRIECDDDFETPAAAWLENAIEVLAKSAREDEPSASESLVVSSSESGRPRYHARVARKQILTHGITDREVVRYTIGLEAGESKAAPFDWQPGDSLNLFYGNDPELARNVIDRLELRPGDVPLADGKSLGELLERHLELRTLSRELVQVIAAQPGGQDLQQVLEEGASGSFESWRETHDLLQLLIENPKVRFEADQLVALLRPLQPRAFSIASSPLCAPCSIDLAVRTVSYEHGGRLHKGVVSGGLSARANEGDAIELQHLPNPSFRLPDDPTANVVMIGAGVGVAPFRAFLQHRAVRGDSGQNWLLHGIRHPNEDELFAEEFSAWREDGLLSAYDLCASRLSEGRQYVQHRITQRSGELFAYLDQGATLYVCGDARHMAKDVRHAIQAIAADQLGSAAKGEAFVEAMHADRRYLQDVY